MLSVPQGPEFGVLRPYLNSTPQGSLCSPPKVQRSSTPRVQLRHPTEAIDTRGLAVQGASSRHGLACSLKPILASNPGQTGFSPSSCRKGWEGLGDTTSSEDGPEGNDRALMRPQQASAFCNPADLDLKECLHIRARLFTDTKHAAESRRSSFLARPGLHKVTSSLRQTVGHYN